MSAVTIPTVERAPRRDLPRWLSGVLGIIGVLIAWQVLAMTLWADSPALPAPTEILSQLAKDGTDFYWSNITTTLSAAIKGWLWGVGIAVFMAIMFVQVPILERLLLKLAIAANCVPLLAIGTILTILFKGDTPKVILAALLVFFATLIAMLVGLESADRTSLDLVKAYGGGRWTQLRKVRLMASLPSLFSGLRIAAPAAILGAILGEYMGGESGLGIAMIASQQALNIERTWGIAFVAAVLSGVGYALTALVGNLLTPWAPRRSQ